MGRPVHDPDTVRDGVRQFRETHGHHDHPVETVRTATYHGHQIVVRTRYRVEVDGRPLEPVPGIRGRARGARF